MQLNSNTPDFNLVLNDEQIPASDNLKYFRLTMSNDMKWGPHILNVTKKANRTLGMIRRCLHTADSKTKLLAFNTVVRPILEYATQVWSPREVGLIKSIDTIHRKAIR